MELLTPVFRYQFVMWWAITLITLVYSSVIGWRLYWATLKIPLGQWRGATFPLPGRRVDYLNFAFAAGFVSVASLWFGLMDLAGAELGWGWLVPALLLAMMNRWGMKMRLCWFVFEDEKPRPSATAGETNQPVGDS